MQLVNANAKPTQEDASIVWRMTETRRNYAALDMVTTGGDAIYQVCPRQ